MPGEVFAGSLSGLHLEQVTVDWGTWVSTPVPGGEGWCIESYHFEHEITPLLRERNELVLQAEPAAAPPAVDRHGRASLPQPVGRVPRLHRQDGNTA